jgi:hypothetical protein
LTDGTFPTCAPARLPARLAVAVSLAAALAAAVPAEAQRGRAREKEPAAPEAVGGGSGLVVGGVQVDTVGKTPNEARLAGWREAQRLAWPALWSRLSGLPQAQAPRLPDSALAAMVSAIEVEQEQLGGGRYVARLAVVFDRARAASFLGNLAGLATSPPFLLIPVLQDAGTRMAYEPDSPWLQAWLRLRAGETPIDYVRIRPAPADTLLLSAWQAERRNLRQWRAIVDRYQVADVVIPELILERSFLGGPVSGLLIVRFGPSGRVLGRLRLSNRAGDVAGLMDEGVRQADRLYIAALRAGNLLPDPTLMEPVAEVEVAEAPAIGAGGAMAMPGMRLRVATPDDATLRSIETLLRATPGVVSVRLASLALGAESILEVATDVPLDALRFNLDQRGLRLVDEPAGRLLRRRQEGEAPVPPPFGEAVEGEPAAPPDGLPAGD